MKIKAPTGMKDLIGNDLSKFRELEAIWKKAVEAEGFNEIITPILEEKALFVRSVGEFSDIVSKEMFVCDDLVLRPEGTAPVMRSFLENNLILPQKLFYYAPFFRKERPQKGRFRQFYQYGIEILGESCPQAEIDLLMLLQKFYTSLNVKFRFEVNYLPSEAALKQYEEELKKFYQENISVLSESSKERLNKGSILRILDSKEDKAINQKAPLVLSFLSPEDKVQWDKILELLTKFKVPVTINPSLVRGLDYYQGFVFEVIDESNTLGSQNALGGGGRYNKLASQLGSKEVVSAVGFGGGVERLLYQLNFLFAEPKSKVGFICSEESEIINLYNLKTSLTKEGFIVDVCLDPSIGFKKMFKRLDKMNFDFAVIIGKDELEWNYYKVKNLKTGAESTINEKYTKITAETFKR